MTIYGAVIMAQSHFESSPSPVHLTNADSTPDGCQPSDQAKQLGLKSPGRLLPSTSAIDNLLLLSLIADTHFTSRGGWKAESAYALKYRCAARTQRCISRGFHDKHNRPQWDLEPGSSHTAVKCTSHYLFCVRDVQEAVHESVNAQNLTGVKDAFATCFGR